MIQQVELKHDHLTRQLGLIPVDTLELPVTIIGCGAIGSFAALSLAKMGFTNLTLWDMDEVSVENMSCQFYRFADIGTNKALALKALIKDFTNVDVQAYPAAWSKEFTAQLTGVVVSAVDSMAVRLEIFEAVKAAGMNVKHIIDPRMAAEFLAMYVMNPFDAKDQATYAKTFYTDEAAEQERCTAKATVYTAGLAAGMIAKVVKHLACRQEYPRITQWSIKDNSNPMVMFPGA